ncbi:MAG TPA: hypothetical protein PLR18_01690 [bacterium]|nr:hypothetical protein [bacterium]
MKKLSKTLISVFVFITILSISTSKAHADMIVTESSFVPGAPPIVDSLIVGGVIIAAIALPSWLIISSMRAIKRKKNVINK